MSHSLVNGSESVNVCLGFINSGKNLILRNFTIFELINVSNCFINGGEDIDVSHSLVNGGEDIDVSHSLVNGIKDVNVSHSLIDSGEDINVSHSLINSVINSEVVFVNELSKSHVKGFGKLFWRGVDVEGGGRSKNCNSTVFHL